MYALISGGFDPLHEGHVRYIQAAAKIGPVIVLLNSDEWLMRKKGYVFMEQVRRAEILRAVKGVAEVWQPTDDDGTVCDGIRLASEHFLDDQLVFCKGGDRSTLEKVPEFDLCAELGIPVMLGIGGYEKPNSSSDLVARVRMG